jgi:P27 family predicted phage terminase small subunit
MAPDNPSAPSHLSAKGRRLFASILERYELDPEGIATLTMAIEAHDLAATARRRLKVEGLIVDGPGGRPMAHPCVGIHRDCMASWRQLLGQLGIPSDEEGQGRNLRGQFQPKGSR